LFPWTQHAELQMQRFSLEVFAVGFHEEQRSQAWACGGGHRGSRMTGPQGRSHGEIDRGAHPKELTNFPMIIW